MYPNDSATGSQNTLCMARLSEATKAMWSHNSEQVGRETHTEREVGPASGFRTHSCGSHDKPCGYRVLF